MPEGPGGPDSRAYGALAAPWGNYGGSRWRVMLMRSPRLPCGPCCGGCTCYVPTPPRTPCGLQLRMRLGADAHAGSRRTALKATL